MLKPPTRPKAHIVASASSLPATYYTQAELAETIVAFLDKHNLDFSRQLVASLFATCASTDGILNSASAISARRRPSRTRPLAQSRRASPIPRRTSEHCWPIPDFARATFR